MNVSEIDPIKAYELCSREEAVIVDVRTPAEFEEVHVSVALNIPLDLLTAESLKKICGDKKALFVCQSGTRGKKACALATEKFNVPAINIVGGTNAWILANLPVNRGNKTISLERQVRIAAGAFVVIGTIVAILFSQIFLAVPLFIGCGLVFAGVTDTCGMAMVLTKMPWNQSKSYQCKM
jgi:rhodanese-related sulfurtransferase